MTLGLTPTQDRRQKTLTELWDNMVQLDNIMANPNAETYISDVISNLEDLFGEPEACNSFGQSQRDEFWENAPVSVGDLETAIGNIVADVGTLSTYIQKCIQAEKPEVPS